MITRADRITAMMASANTALLWRERTGVREPWEECTCCAGGDPPWHDSGSGLYAQCPRSPAEMAAQSMRGVLRGES